MTLRLRLAALALMMLSLGYSAMAAQTPADSEWPQYSGPNRDSVVASTPKLIDVWPKQGPPLAWKSEWIPGWFQGGCSGPVVADGKVFVYATSKNPVGGGSLYKLVTPDVLAAAGWLPNLPPELAKKIEDARTAKDRPSCNGWPWWEIKDPKEKEKQLSAFLAKKPELDKYIKDFIARLGSDEISKYSDFIRQRLCIPPATDTYWENGCTWANLEKLSKLQDVGLPSLREWSRTWEKTTGLQTLGHHFQNGRFLAVVWGRSFTRSDILACLDASTGKTLWKKDFPLEPEIQLKADSVYAHLGICGTPAINDGKCYFGGARGLYCLSAKDGSPLWQVKCPPSHTSPMVVNGIVYYCGCAYQAGTGQVLWKNPRWKSDNEWYSQTPPMSWKAGGNTYLLASNGGNMLCCLALETGKELWTLPIKAFEYGPAAYALRSDSDILMAEGKLYRLTPAALQPLEITGEPLSENMVGAGLMYQGHFYAETGGGHNHPKVDGLCCWELKTSDRNVSFTMKWNAPHMWSWYAPPIVADGKIIMANGPGGGQEDWIYNNFKVVMLKETSEKYTPLGTLDPGMIPWAPLALANGRLFVRTESGITCFDLRQ